MEKRNLIFLAFFILAAVTAQDSSDSSESASNESTEAPLIEEEAVIPAEIVDPNKSYFINSVHSIAAKIAKNLVINDNKVVWSPFSVVNAITLVENKDEKLLNGFKSAITYLTHENPLNTTFISIGYTRNETILSRNYTGLKMHPLKADEDVNKLLQQTFLSLTNFSNANHNQDADNETSSTPDKLTLNFTQETVLLTGLGIESLWSVPFHPRYAKKSKFYLNETHVVKSTFMNNIGFYKYAELPEWDAVGVAVPLKSAQTYAIFIKPNNKSNLETLNSHFDNVENFTEIFRNKFKTRRVQFGMPKVNIDSQFPITTESINALQISSLKISFTGLYNSFHAPMTSFRPVKFQRLRRRPDDAKFKLDSPYIFHLYDDQFTGFLMSGLVLNPLDPEHELIDVYTPPLMLDPEIKLAKEIANEKCFQSYQTERKAVNIYQDISVKCSSDNKNYSEIINRETLFKFATTKTEQRKFYTNEVEYFNVTFGEVVSKVKYTSFGNAFDGKVIQIKNDTTSLYVFIPNERSGLYRVENGLEQVPFSAITCQMRDIHLRLRVPWINSVGGFGFQKGGDDTSSKGSVDQVPIERSGRKSKNKNKRYRKMNIDRSFFYIVTEEGLTGGGFVAMGRVVGSQIVNNFTSSLI